MRNEKWKGDEKVAVQLHATALAHSVRWSGAGGGEDCSGHLEVEGEGAAVAASASAAATPRDACECQAARRRLVHSLSSFPFDCRK